MTRLGIDSFSYHRWFGEANRWEEPVAARWTYVDFLNRAHALDVGLISLQTVHLPMSDTLLADNLKESLALRNMDCVIAWGHRSGLQDGKSPERLADAIQAMRLAAQLGCQVVRVVCGDQFSWRPSLIQRRERAKDLMPCLKALAGEAAGLQITLAIENHADFIMEDLIDLVEAIDSDHVGVCFDIANVVRVGDDPILAARIAVARIVMVQVRDLKIQPDSVGRPWLWWPSVPLGTGGLPLDDVLAILRSAPCSPPWFIEISNTYTGYFEDDIVSADLTYLRTYLAP